MTSLASTFQNKKIVFLDMDGTIYLGEKLIQGTERFLSSLKKNGIKYYYLSNNSSRSKSDYVSKLDHLGIPSNTEEIILSTDGVIDFLNGKKIDKTYVVGTQSMKDMFTQAGIEVESQNPTYVILGFDTELNYKKIKTAALFLQKDIPMLATHKDLVCPTQDGPIPDVGALLALFEKATGKMPVKVFGKPNKEMLGSIIKRHKATADELVIIGDRIYTDMEMANNIGCDFILVLSGETQKEDVARLKIQPALVVDNIGQLISD
jgi:HAD superfamily hydrolase (TIGR01450 family)